ncbi:pescadillo-like [Lycodopsis pacificus]
MALQRGEKPAIEEEEEEDDEEAEEEEEEEEEEENEDDDEEVEEKNLKKMEEQRSQGKSLPVKVTAGKVKVDNPARLEQEERRNVWPS